MNLGLDSSVLLRLLTGTPADQAGAARKRIQTALAAGDEVLITDLIFAECYHALVHHYGVEKIEAQKKLAALATSGVFRIEPPEAAQALAPAAGAGLVDRLILQRYRSLHATALTFDKAMGAAGATKVPKA